MWHSVSCDLTLKLLPLTYYINQKPYVPLMWITNQSPNLLRKIQDFSTSAAAILLFRKSFLPHFICLSQPHLSFKDQPNTTFSMKTCSFHPLPKQKSLSIYTLSIYTVFPLLIETIFTGNHETRTSASLKVCVLFILLHLQILAQDLKQSCDSICIY